MKIRITDPSKDVSLINRAFQQQEQLTNKVSDLEQNVFTQVNLPISTGQGTPLGRVVAPIGSLYLRTDGGTDSTLYIKESGDGANTGWVPVEDNGGGGTVTSVFGRTGAVVAVSGDYTVGQVTGAAPLASPALTGTPTAPTATLGTNTSQLATTAFVQANAGSGSTAGILGRRRQAFGSADGTTTTLGTNGSNSTGGDVFVIAGSAIAEAAGATMGPSVGIFASATSQITGLSGNANYRTGRNIAFWGLCGAAGKITDERWWFGLTDQTLATQGASANPAGNYAAFRFDTTVPDSVWQAITKDGTTQNIQSTGVAPVINTPQTFSIIFNDSIPNVTFYINGALVVTSTTHLPSASTNLRFVFTNECFTSTTNNGLTFEQVFVASDL